MRHNHCPDLLSQLRGEWRRVGRSAPSRRSLCALRESARELVPCHLRDLDGLVELLEPSGGADTLTRARLVALLLEHAEDPLVRRCLLQTMLPGIVAVARKLRFGDGIADSPSSFLADTLAEAADLLCDWAGQRRPYAGPDLLSALRCRLRRRLLSEKARRVELRALPERPAPRDLHGPGTLAHRLAVDASAGGDHARLLYARCVLDVPTTQLAAALGVSAGVIRRRLVTAASPYLGVPS